jgi:hypothetical protein
MGEGAGAKIAPAYLHAARAQRAEIAAAECTGIAAAAGTPPPPRAGPPIAWAAAAAHVEAATTAAMESTTAAAMSAACHRHDRRPTHRSPWRRSRLRSPKALGKSLYVTVSAKAHLPNASGHVQNENRWKVGPVSTPPVKFVKVAVCALSPDDGSCRHFVLQD